MDEKTAVSDARAFLPRLRRTRFATRLAVTQERLWPIALPLAIVV